MSNITLFYNYYRSKAYETHETLLDAIGSALCMVEYNEGYPTRIAVDGVIVWNSDEDPLCETLEIIKNSISTCNRMCLLSEWDENKPRDCENCSGRIK